MKENGRIVQNHCENAQFQTFIKKVQTLPNFLLKNYKPASENTLQERYSFAYGNKHVSIVYETNSATLVVTASEQVLPILKNELNLNVNVNACLQSVITHKPQENTDKLDIVSTMDSNSEPKKQMITRPNGKKQPEIAQSNSKKEIIITLQDNKKQANISESDEKKQIIINQSDNKRKKQEEEHKKSDQQHKKQEIERKKLDEENKKREEEHKKSDQQHKKQEIERKKLDEENKKREDEYKKLDELYKNGFAIKKYQPEKLDNVLKNIKTIKGISFRQNASETGSRTYLITDKKNKVYLRYIDSKKTLQLQGKRSKLFGEIQVLVSQDSDYVTAVSSHIDLTGEEKRARDMEKRLKKLLPTAFDFLSEQSRIDLTIGMIDIGNDDVKLSDYSMLLVPPYRGLERLIYDLQRAKGIEVKMIGQAYEKLGGDYTLKSGYKRKINSIVYSEVMSALYTEYFAKRNFYAHSDITGDLLSRVITEKSAVKEIFKQLTEMIEYNISKLKEIGFKI